MSEKKGGVDNPRKWEQELKKFLKNGSVIFWSAMTCFAMLGNIGDGQNRVVHAQGNIENDREGMTISGMPYSKVEFRPDSMNELILQKVAEKNLELHQVGIDVKGSKLLQIAMLLEAIGKTEGEYTAINWPSINQLLPDKMAQDLKAFGYGDMECVETLTFAGANGLIDAHLVIPGNSAYEAVKELKTRQRYRKNDEFNLVDRDNVRVVVIEGINDPRLTDHQTSVFYMLSEKEKPPGHAFILLFDTKNGLVIKIASNEKKIVSENGDSSWEFGGGDPLSVEVMHKDLLEKYLQGYYGKPILDTENLFMLSMPNE